MTKPYVVLLGYYQNTHIHMIYHLGWHRHTNSGPVLSTTVNIHWYSVPFAYVYMDRPMQLREIM